MFEIRLITVDDAEAVAGIYAHYVRHTAITFDTEAPDASSFRQMIVERLRCYPWLVAVEKPAEDETESKSGAGSSPAVLGYAYASQHRSRHAYRWSVDTSMYIRDSHHRRGIGRALYARLLPILRRQGFRMVHAGITLPNAGSVGLHEAIGFRRVGVFPKVGFKGGQWRDVGWWALDLFPSETGVGPAEPLDFPNIVPMA